MNKNKRAGVGFGIPEEIRGPLVFVLFSAIVGIVIQSIGAGQLVFRGFFTTNYIDWFKSFGLFAERIQTTDMGDFFLSIAKSWYYFLLSGGLLALIWGFLNWIINFEWRFSSFKKKEGGFFETASMTQKSLPSVDEMVALENNKK